MTKLTRISLLCAALAAFSSLAQAETSLAINHSPATAYQIAATQFLPEADDSISGFAGRNLKGNYNSGEPLKRGCSEGSTTPCSQNQIKQKTYVAPNGRLCYVCKNGDANDCISLGFKLQQDWVKPSNGNWQFQLTETCIYNRNYIKGKWNQITCALPDCVAVTTKPSNSTYVSGSCTDCTGTKTINTGWKCDDGYMEANGSCIKKTCSVTTCSSEYIYSSSSSCPKGKGLGYASCTPVSADCTTGKTKYKCTCTPYMENGRWVQCAVR